MKNLTAPLLLVAAVLLAVGSVAAPALASSHDDKPMSAPVCANAPATAGQPDAAGVQKWLGEQAKAGKHEFLVVPGAPAVLCAW